MVSLLGQKKCIYFLEDLGVKHIVDVAKLAEKLKGKGVKSNDLQS